MNRADLRLKLPCGLSGRWKLTHAETFETLKAAGSERGTYPHFGIREEVLVWLQTEGDSN